ncbi:MAG: glycosyltransferase family 4 protein [Acidimicrobiales bacterium]
MSRVHQVVVAASPGDAITNAALDLRTGLRTEGRSELFAAYVDPALAGEVHPLAEFARLGAGADLLVVHLSIGDPQIAELLAHRPEPLAVVYHNMSPAEAFWPWDQGLARSLAEGRRELGSLADRVRLAVAVSAYNAAELAAMGYPRVEVSPLAVDPATLLGTDVDVGLASELAGLDGPRLLYVGQLLPHKRVDWLITAYHALVTHLVPEAHLLLVGADRVPSYGHALRRLVAELALPRVRFTGPVSQEALVTYFRYADAFVTASEHEGFCVPLLEAMAFGVPVLARAFAAVPDTLGGAGLLLGSGDGPLVGAEALNALIDQPGLRADLVEGGRHRLEALDPDRARARMLSHVLGAARP